MDVIFSLLSSIFDITLVGGAIFCIIKFFEFRRNLLTKNEIQTLQARVSMLRMALKSKVKKKANSFRSKFVKPINIGDPFDIAIGELTDNKFETGEDFQSYFDLSKRINSFINADVQLTTDIATNMNTSHRFEDFMGPDLKNELAIIRTIKEITDATMKYNVRAEAFNRLKPKAKVPIIDALIFDSLSAVNRIFRDDVDKNPDTPDHSDAA